MPEIKVVFTRRAAAQLEQVSNWWNLNRPAALDAVADDFAVALEVLKREPHLGMRVSQSRKPDIRRFYMERIGYWVYYRAQVVNNVMQLEIVAVWHASRGAAPKL